jgi:hypothetical protein
MRSIYVNTVIVCVKEDGIKMYLMKIKDGWDMPVLYCIGTGEVCDDITHAVAEECALNGKRGCYLEYRNWI